MAIFNTDTASFAEVDISGSASHRLKVRGSGSAIVTVSGSAGGLLEISDLSAGRNIFTIASASIDVFSINQSQRTTISGSLTVTSGITGSLLGTASFLTSSSFATTASFALNAGTSGTSGTSGTTGTSGTSGTSGTAGTSGVSPTGQIILTAAGSWPSITSGANLPVQAQTTTNLVNFYYVGFPDTTQLFTNWAMPMPSDYNGGTITAVFYWVAGTASTNSVRWGLAARAYADSDLLDQAFGTAQEVTDANQANDDVNISAATPAITIGGTPAASNYVQFRAYRDPANAADNLAATAELLSIRITYTRV